MKNSIVTVALLIAVALMPLTASAQMTRQQCLDSSTCRVINSTALWVAYGETKTHELSCPYYTTVGQTEMMGYESNTYPWYAWGVEVTNEVIENGLRSTVHSTYWWWVTHVIVLYCTW